MSASGDSAARLEALLRDMDATVSAQLANGASSENTYVIGQLSIHLLADYGSWRANISLGDGPQFPASFWIAALGGSTAFPEPVVTTEDLDHLTAQLPQLLAEAPRVEHTVESMGDQYREAMKERLS